MHATHHFTDSLDSIIKGIKHYLPSQAPLKDFIHHNTLHAFQNLPFHEALHLSSEVFGAKLYLLLSEYRALYEKKEIHADALNRALEDYLATHSDERLTLNDLIYKNYDTHLRIRIGQLRKGWKKTYSFDLDSKVHPLLFRYLCNFLDQGISVWPFPKAHMSFLEALREMEEKSFVSLFRAKNGRARKMFLDSKTEISDFLKIIVGPQELHERYLQEQQMVHPGWSGLVSVIEDHPETLIDSRAISLKGLIFFELALELDHLDYYLKDWKPLGEVYRPSLKPLFNPVIKKDLHAVYEIWQTAYEFSFYDQVLNALQKAPLGNPPEKKVLQAVFCIDDRECSFRRYIEATHPGAETLSTPGFFSAEFFYQPENGKFFTKLCPAPMTPKYLIKQQGSRQKRGQDFSFKSNTHSFFGGWFISQTLGFWSAFKLFVSIFRPSVTPATSFSFKHMDKASKLVIENDHVHHHEFNMQLGYTVSEMADRVQSMLQSMGLVDHFAPVVYLIGHGSSSVNNPHYAAYDCGACSGRAGSVNARVAAHMANNVQVRQELQQRGLIIPRTTRFVGALHDTSRDEVEFFDEENIPLDMNPAHILGQKVIAEALEKNAKERARRFILLNPKDSAKSLLEKVRRRSVSLFEPRPELNHATNTLCIVGGRHLTKNVFMDRRAFLNSYDPHQDPEGEILTKILSAAVPVCGGINLEYFFSRVDNEKFGAGTKLPHNVMGLVGVANGIDGDLRTGLPSQMIEVHDPIRLLMIVEHNKDAALKAIQRNATSYEWVENEWMYYVSIDPLTRKVYLFKEGKMEEYSPLETPTPVVTDITKYVESSSDNLPIALLQKGGG